MISAPAAQLELSRNHLRYLVLLLCPTIQALIKSLWARVALFCWFVNMTWLWMLYWRMVLLTLDAVTIVTYTSGEWCY
jgi:hypothetical protein